VNEVSRLRAGERNRQPLQRVYCRRSDSSPVPAPTVRRCCQATAKASGDAVSNGLAVSPDFGQGPYSAPLPPASVSDWRARQVARGGSPSAFDQVGCDPSAVCMLSDNFTPVELSKTVLPQNPRGYGLFLCGTKFAGTVS
jgi:hypothetical protein